MLRSAGIYFSSLPTGNGINLGDYDQTARKGQWAIPTDPLKELVNVGGARLILGETLANVPFVKKALHLISTAAVQGLTMEGQNPSEWNTDRWSRHILYLIKVGVLEKCCTDFKP